MAMYLMTEPAHEVESGLVDLELARSVPRHRLLTRSLLLAGGSTAVAILLMFAGTAAGGRIFDAEGMGLPSVAIRARLLLHLAGVAACFGSFALLLATLSRRWTTAFTTAALTASCYALDFSRLAGVRSAQSRLSLHYYPALSIVAGDARTSGTWRFCSARQAPSSPPHGGFSGAIYSAPDHRSAFWNARGPCFTDNRADGRLAVHTCTHVSQASGWPGACGLDAGVTAPKRARPEPCWIAASDRFVCECVRGPRAAGAQNAALALSPAGRIALTPHAARDRSGFHDHLGLRRSSLRACVDDRACLFTVEQSLISSRSHSAVAELDARSTVRPSRSPRFLLGPRGWVVARPRAGAFVGSGCARSWRAAVRSRRATRRDSPPRRAAVRNDPNGFNILVRLLLRLQAEGDRHSRLRRHRPPTRSPPRNRIAYAVLGKPDPSRPPSRSCAATRRSVRWMTTKSGRSSGSCCGCARASASRRASRSSGRCVLSVSQGPNRPERCPRWRADSATVEGRCGMRAERRQRRRQRPGSASSAPTCRWHRKP